MVAFGWTVLALVFLDELLAMVAAGVWGAYAGGLLLAMLMPLAVVVVWFLFASPKAPYGGLVVRPVVKVLVFSLTSLGLAAAGHPGWGIALFGFSLLVNGLAQLPAIRALTEQGMSGKPT